MGIGLYGKRRDFSVYTKKSLSFFLVIFILRFIIIYVLFKNDYIIKNICDNNSDVKVVYSYFRQILHLKFIPSSFLNDVNTLLIILN